MITTSVLLPSCIFLFVLVLSTSAKFDELDMTNFKNPLSRKFRQEFLPIGDQISEVCWVQGLVLANATVYGGITDCFPHNWHCVMDDTKHLTPKLRNIQCIEKDVVSNPSEFICSYRWFTKRTWCKDKSFDCFRIFMACEHKFHHFRSNILIPISAFLCVVVLIAVCVKLTRKHYRYINRHPINVSSASPKHYESQEMITFMGNESTRSSFVKKTNNDVNKRVPETQMAVANVVHHTMV